MPICESWPVALPPRLDMSLLWFASKHKNPVEFVNPDDAHVLLDEALENVSIDASDEEGLHKRPSNPHTRLHA